MLFIDVLPMVGDERNKKRGVELYESGILLILTVTDLAVDVMVTVCVYCCACVVIFSGGGRGIGVAKVLVDECGAELETRNKKGDTALGLACFWGNADTVK